MFYRSRYLNIKYNVKSKASQYRQLISIRSGRLFRFVIGYHLIRTNFHTCVRRLRVGLINFRYVNVSHFRAPNMRNQRFLHVLRPFIRRNLLTLRRSSIRTCFLHLRRCLLTRNNNLYVRYVYLRSIRLPSNNMGHKRIRTLQSSRFTSYLIAILKIPGINM